MGLVDYDSDESAEVVNVTELSQSSSHKRAKPKTSKTSSLLKVAVPVIDAAAMHVQAIPPATRSLILPNPKVKSEQVDTRTEKVHKKAKVGSLFSCTEPRGTDQVSSARDTVHYDPILADASLRRRLSPPHPELHQSEHDQGQYNDHSDAQAEPKKSRKRPREWQDITITHEIDADQRYLDNIQYKENVQEEAGPIRFIGGGKHQLSSLLSAAMSQKESLESNFAKQKKNLRESKAKYGR